MNDKYILNHQTFTKDGILNFAADKLNQPELTEWEHDLYSFIQTWFSGSAYVSIYTSGSTGTPKEIKILKERMRLSAQRTLDYFEVEPLENILLCLPVKYIAGMMMVVRAFTGLLNLIAVSPNQLKIDRIEDTIGFASMVPLQIERLIDQHQPLDRIQKLLLGGTPVSENLSNKLKSSFKGQLWETYGMTETITHVAVRKLRDEAQVFHALPGITFSIDNRDCLMINDPLVQDLAVQTNDRVELLSATSFRLLGRVDYVINSGGIKIQPEVLERTLEPYMTVRFCITSIPDESLGEMLVLVVEKGVNPESIQRALTQIGSYSRPRKIFELEKIPVTNNGKIDLKAVNIEISKLSFH